VNEVCAALNLVSKLCHTNIIVACSEIVHKLLQHKSEAVRKKAVTVLINFNKVQPIEEMDAKMRRCLCDKDPAVMSATLNYFYDQVRQRPSEYKDLAQSLLMII